MITLPPVLDTNVYDESSEKSVDAKLITGPVIPENAYGVSIDLQRHLEGHPEVYEVEFQVSSTHIQWRCVGDVDWIDLISLDTLKIKGDPGFPIEQQWNELVNRVAALEKPQA